MNALEVKGLTKVYPEFTLDKFARRTHPFIRRGIKVSMKDCLRNSICLSERRSKSFPRA